MSLFDSYVESNQDAGRIMYATVGFQGVSQSITSVGAANLTSVKFYLRKSGSPTGNITANVYAHSGTYGTSSIPTGSPLVTGVTLDSATLTTSYVLYEFTFGSPYAMSAATRYVIAAEYASGDGSNYVEMGVDSSSPSHSGNHATLFLGTWTASNTRDAIFYAYDDATVPDLTVSVSDTITISESVQRLLVSGVVVTPGIQQIGGVRIV